MIEKRVVTQLFYLLLRDQMPAGVLIKMVNELERDDEVVYTNVQLQALAEDLASRIGE